MSPPQHPLAEPRTVFPAAAGAAFPGEALTRMGHLGSHPLLGQRGLERRDVRGLVSLRTALEPACSDTRATVGRPERSAHVTRPCQ